MRPPAPEAGPEAAPLPRAEVAALWAACERLDATAADPGPLALELAGWLSCERALYPPAVAALDLARVLPSPRDHGYPPWLPASWWPRYRLALPVWTAAGERGGVRLRCVGDAQPAERGPWRASSKGLTLADPVALALLQGKIDLRWDRSVLVVGSCLDFLTWAIRPWGEWQPAILGTWGGAWSPDLAARIPDGARVILATAADPAGDRLALAIQKTVFPRCACGRMKVSQP